MFGIVQRTECLIQSNFFTVGEGNKAAMNLRQYFFYLFARSQSQRY